MTLNETLHSLAGVLALACAANVAAAEPVTIKMTSTWPSGIDLIEADKHFVETVNRLGGDQVKIQFFEGGALVPSTQVFDATASGTVDAAGDWAGYWAGQSPAFALLGSYPMLLTAGDYILWLQQWGGFEMFQEAYGRFGMVYLPYGVVSMESGLRCGKPLASLTDHKGKRVRMSGRPQGAILRELGAAQVMVPGSEVYPALERGVVDCAEFSSPGTDWGMGLQEVSKHWTVPGWHQPGSVVGVMINKKAWDKLGPDAQALLKTAADATMTWSLAFYNKGAVEATRRFREAGTEIYKLTPEELERLQKLANAELVKESCENPLFAKIAASQVQFLQEYADWRELQGQFGFGRNPTMPDLQKIKACAEKK